MKRIGRKESGGKGWVKGIVQRDVRGVESRLKRSVLINCLVAIVPFFKLKGRPCESGKKPVSAS
jgi:hypothetical protein